MNVRARLRRGCLLSLLAAGGLAAALAAAGCGSTPDLPAVHVACPHVKHHPPPRKGALIIGLNSVWNDTCNLASITSAGVTMERLEIGWPDVERSRGHWDWRHFDHVVGTAAKGGVTVLPLLMSQPSWLHVDINTIPSDPSGFADYVTRVVRRYGPQGSFWRSHPRIPYRPAVWFEIWNEPYLTQFSTGGPRPDAYARLFKAAALAGRRANPATRYLLAADTDALLPGGAAIGWVDAMYRAVPDLDSYFDGIAVHPYSGPHPPNLLLTGTPTSEGFRRIELLRQQFVAHGAALKPFWITEIGWSTCPADPETCVSERNQATYIREVFDAVRTKYSSWVRAVFIYNYRDSPAASNPADKERWFGLIRRNGSPKPAWGVLQAEGHQ